MTRLPLLFAADSTSLNLAATWQAASICLPAGGPGEPHLAITALSCPGPVELARGRV